MLDARTITAALVRQCGPTGFVLPNVTPPGWHECDVVLLYDGDARWREYEVKVSRNDWKRDAGKRRREVKGYRDGAWTILIPGRTKYERLAAGDPAGPNEFYYLTPPGLLEPDEMPPWAGLMVCGERQRPGQMPFAVPKKAPVLHEAGPSPELFTHLRRACYRKLMPFLVETAGPVI